MKGSERSVRVLNSYNGFTVQKKRWAKIDTSASRLKILASLQIVIAVALFGHTFWCSSSIGIVVAVVGLQVVRSEKLHWTILYLLFCMVQFTYNAWTIYVQVLSYINEGLPKDVRLSVQSALLLLESVILLPCIFYVIFTAIANMTNPFWRHRHRYEVQSAETLV